eukprot:12458790-Alexandrium_andersonii.AAC.1
MTVRTYLLTWRPPPGGWVRDRWRADGLRTPPALCGEGRGGGQASPIHGALRNSSEDYGLYRLSR